MQYFHGFLREMSNKCAAILQTTAKKYSSGCEKLTQITCIVCHIEIEYNFTIIVHLCMLVSCKSNILHFF